MGNGAHGAIVYRGYRPHGQWGTGGMGHIDNRATEGMGYKGYGQWGTGVWGLWAMEHRGYGPHRQWVTWGTGLWAYGQ